MDSLIALINIVLSNEFHQKISKIKNPYGDGKTSQRIKKIIDKTNLDKLINKEFYDLPC